MWFSLHSIPVYWPDLFIDSFIVEYLDCIADRFLYSGIIGHYMEMDQAPSRHMDRRAFLTEREREVIRGEADDVEDLPGYQSKVRSRLRNRLGRLKGDLEVLHEHEPEIAEELHEAVCGDPESRLSKLEAEVASLRDEIDDQ